MNPREILAWIGVSAVLLGATPLAAAIFLEMQVGIRALLAGAP
ncbi:hypothetical protein [Roseomonas xinghualingensis]|nr:hypothetical protein [Roseomonas sp. SXEYE001]MCV4207540.1 hypothetical protein [Roseomonas sp. SXEYE001]